MNQKLDISLILTTKNEERSIQTFLESVAKQTCIPSEIVICDGGSTDSTCKQIEKWEFERIDVLLIIEADASIARGRNIAIQNAKYSIIAISDAGCVLDQNWIRNITAPLSNEGPIDVVAGGYVLHWRNKFERIAAAAEIKSNEIPLSEFLPSSRSFAIRKSVWEETGGYPEYLSFAGEDTAYCLQLKMKGKIFSFRPDAIVTWYPRSTIQAYIKQHYLYGIGDGESKAKTIFYLKIILKHSLTLALFIGSFVSPVFIAVLCSTIFIYYLYLSPKYHWDEIPIAIGFQSYLLISVKELSVLLGWIRGLIRMKKADEA